MCEGQDVEESDLKMEESFFSVKREFRFPLYSWTGFLKCSPTCQLTRSGQPASSHTFTSSPAASLDKSSQMFMKCLPGILLFHSVVFIAIRYSLARP